MTGTKLLTGWTRVFAWLLAGLTALSLAFGLLLALVGPAAIKQWTGIPVVEPSHDLLWLLEQLVALALGVACWMALLYDSRRAGAVIVVSSLMEAGLQALISFALLLHLHLQIPLTLPVYVAFAIVVDKRLTAFDKAQARSRAAISEAGA